MIKAVIIDDSPAMLELSHNLLKEYFPEISIAGKAGNVGEAVSLIQTEKPNLVLLDIELRGGSGFQVLQQLKPYNFQVIFITGFDSYAIKAIKYSALDYLLKPVNESEFQQAVQRAINQIDSKTDISVQTNVLFDSLDKKIKKKKLLLKTANSMHIVDISEILYCKSDNSYTTFYLNKDEKIIVSKSIKEYEELLYEYKFFRSHQSYLVNLNHIKKIDKSDGGFIIMKNKKEIPVSIRQKKQLMSSLEKL